MPEDIKKYDLPDYAVRENDVAEARALKKAGDALANDPFFKGERNKGVADILRWLIQHKHRCEQQVFFSVNQRDQPMPEKIIVEKIRRGDYVQMVYIFLVLIGPYYLEINF